jgi:hypothetical protein
MPVSEGFEPTRQLTGGWTAQTPVACIYALGPHLFGRRIWPSVAPVVTGDEHDPALEREKSDSSNVHRDGSNRPSAWTNLRAAPQQR